MCMSRLALVVVLYQATRTHGTAPLVPTSPTCIEWCTDQPNAYMDQNGLACDDYPYAYDKLCTHNDNWRSRKFCQRSCYENGAGYDGDVCCAEKIAPLVWTSVDSFTAPLPAETNLYNLHAWDRWVP